MTLLLYISFTVYLLLVSAEDYQHMLISDRNLIFFSILHLVLQTLRGQGLVFAIQGLVLGASFYYLVYLFCKKIYGQEAFGMGDVLLMGSIGLVLGGQKAILAGCLAFYISLIYILLLRVKRGKIDRKERIPFVPSISVASFLILIFGDKIIELIQFL